MERNNYIKYVKKNTTVSGQKTKIVNPYTFCEQICFLKDHYNERETWTNIIDQVTSHNLTEDNNESVFNENKLNHFDSESDEDFHQLNYQITEKSRLLLKKNHIAVKCRKNKRGQHNTLLSQLPST